MPYKLKISGLQFEGEIEGAQDWARSVTRDFNDRIFRTRPEYKFIGHKGLYSLLYNHISLNGVCEALEGRIYFNTGTNWDYEWKGDILPQDIEYDLLKRAADGQVLDASWSAKFNNSQDQKVFLKGQTSKRGNPILSATSELCDFFTPSTGAYDVTNRECYRVYDVFTYLVDYYSDGTVTFDSSFFTTGGDGDQYYITTGKEIRTGNQNANPEISFSELFDEMNKKCNLWIVIEGTQDAPILKIEPQSYVFQNQLLLTIADPETIIMKTDLDQLYTIIKVGGDAPEFDPANNANYPTPRFEAWNSEQYNTPGDCEFENNTLDLTSTYKIDANSIEQIIVGASEDYDDEIFIVEIDPTNQNAFQFTTQYTGSDTVEYIYNFNLTNPQVLEAWFDGIPQEIIVDIGYDYYVYVDSVAGKTNITSITYGLDYTNDSVAPAQDTDNIYTTKSENPSKEGQFKSPADLVFRVKGAVTVTNPDAANDIDFLCPRIVIYEDDTLSTVIRVIYVNIDGSAKTGSTVQFTPILWGATVTMPIDLDMYIGADNVAKLDIFYNDLTRTGYNLQSAYVSMETVAQNLTTAPDAPLIFLYDTARFQLSRADFDTLDQGRGFVRILDTNGNKAYDVWAKDVKYNSTKGIVEVAEWIGTTPPIEVCWVLETGSWDDTCYWLDNEILVDTESLYFIITVKTDNPGTSAADQFELPTTGAGYSYYIDWGDDTNEIIVTGSPPTHTYPASGTYTIKIAGTFPRIYFNNTKDRRKLLTIEQWGDISWTSMENAFWGCSNMTGNFTDAPDLNGVTTLASMMRACTSYDTTIDQFDVSTIKDFSNMFRDTLNYDQTMNSWDTSAGTTMSAMFKNCSSFNGNVSSWDTSSVTTMANMFEAANTFNQDISAWVVSAVTDFGEMFRNAVAFNQDISGWTTTAALTMDGMFRNTTIFNVDLDSWDINGVTNLSSMFENATGFNQALNSWDTSTVTNMTSMFEQASSFNANITGWDTSAVTNMSSMFQNATVFDQNISGWDVGSVSNFSAMFRSCAFNRNLNTWDTSSGTNMSSMFRSNTAFNGTINGWSVGSVTNMASMFEGATAFNKSLSSWTVTSVTNMSSMFNGATAFDQDIGNWTVSAMTNATNMFLSVTLSTANYNALLTGWTGWTLGAPTKSLQSNVTFHAGGSTYSTGTDAEDARTYLTDPTPGGENWSITDGGGV